MHILYIPLILCLLVLSEQNSKKVSTELNILAPGKISFKLTGSPSLNKVFELN